MKNTSSFKLSAIGLAVQISLMAVSFSANAEDSEVQALITPSNSIEAGLTNVSTDSAKFGEYNGLSKSGPTAISNFSLRGGDSYGMKDGLSRWSAEGVNLGGTSRSLGFSVGEQGNWTLEGGYDELRHVITDTYQTPYLGTMGGGRFVLPSSFGVINTNNTSTQVQNTESTTRLGSAVPFGAQAMTSSQQASFQLMEVYSGRKNYNLTWKMEVSPQMGIRVDYGHLVQDGAKLTSAYTDKANAFSVGGSSTANGIVVLPMPTNYTTDNVNLAVNWAGQDSTLTYGTQMSSFTNAVNGLKFSNPFYSNSTTSPTGTNLTGASGFPLDTLSTAPSNLAGQFFINGTHKFSSATKLTAGFTRGQNSQNSAYASDATAVSTPVTSLSGLVVTTHYDAKLTHQINKDVALFTSYRFNDRDNRTKVYQYDFLPVNQLTTGTVNHALNTPVSTRRTQYDLGADWKLDSARSIRFAFDQDNYDRSCDNQAAYNNVGALASGVQTPYYTAGYSCVQVPHSKESKESVSYRSRANDTLNYSVGYTHADKKSDVNGSYYNPMKADVEGLNVAGFLAYFQASRKQDALKSSVNWQATEVLDLSISGKYATDKYGDSTYGVQKGSTWSLNLDGTYALSDDSSVTGYYTLQHRQREMLNSTTGSQPWLNTLHDNDVTVGLSFKRSGLMQSKLKLSGDISTTNAISGYATDKATSASTACATTPGTSGWTCGNTPDINTRLLRLKLGAEYSIDKDSKFLVSALHQRLQSDDPYYNFYQFGYNGTGALPTGQQSGSYNVNVISMGFLHNF